MATTTARIPTTRSMLLTVSQQARQPLSDVTSTVSNVQPSTTQTTIDGKPAPKSNKRKAAEEPEDRSWLDIDIGDTIRVDQSGAQVRNKIRRYIDSGAMTVKDFCAAIDVSTVSYYRFMNAGGGHKGEQSDTFIGALGFFKKREAAGLKMPSKKAKIASGTSSKAKSSGPVDLSGIYLDGQEEDDVEVYDTCNEVRKKITAYLRRDGVTVASFLREVNSQLYGPKKKAKGFQSKQLNDFRGYSFPTQGNSSALFYGAYVFFEKLRMKEGKPKSEHRLEMENQWPSGFDLELRRGSLVTAATHEVVENELGHIRSVPIGRGWL